MVSIGYLEGEYNQSIYKLYHQLSRINTVYNIELGIILDNCYLDTMKNNPANI